MPDKFDRAVEAYRRGLMGPETTSRFDEALSRGLFSNRLSDEDQFGLIVERERNLFPQRQAERKQNLEAGRAMAAAQLRQPEREQQDAEIGRKRLAASTMDTMLRFTPLGSQVTNPGGAVEQGIRDVGASVTRGMADIAAAPFRAREAVFGAVGLNSPVNKAIGDQIERFRNSEALAPSVERSGDTAKSLITDMGTVGFWTNQVPEMVVNVMSNLVPAAKVAQLANSVRVGAAVGSAIAAAQETGNSFDSMRDDLIAEGVPEDMALKVAGRGAVSYGILAGLIERGILPLQLLRGKNPASGWVRQYLIGGVGETAEEMSQKALEGVTRLMAADAAGVELDSGLTGRAFAEAGLVAFPVGGGVRVASGRGGQDTPVSDPESAPPPQTPGEAAGDVSAQTGPTAQIQAENAAGTILEAQNPPLAEETQEQAPDPVQTVLQADPEAVAAFVENPSRKNAEAVGLTERMSGADRADIRADTVARSGEQAQQQIGEVRSLLTKATGGARSLADTLDTWADAKLAEARSTTFSGVDPQLYAAAAAKGAALILRGTATTADWTAAMVEQFGERVKQHLPQLREESDSIVADVQQRIEQGDPDVGRADLANPGETEQVRNIVREVDEGRNLDEQPDTHSRAEATVEADAMLAEDGGADNLRAKLRNGEKLSDTETVAALRVMNDDLLAAIANDDAEAEFAARQLLDGYRRGRTEVARSLAIGFDRFESPQQRRKNAIATALTAPTKQQAKELADIDEQLARPGADTDTLIAKRDQIIRRQTEEIKKLRQELRDLGWDLATIDQIAADPDQAHQLGNDISALRATFWDKAHEFWIASILSGPKTQVRNIVGNTANTAWEFTAQRLAEVFTNLFQGDASSAQIGEFAHILKAIRPGLRHGLGRLARTWKTEQPMFEDEVGGKGTTKIETLRGPKIKGRKGKIIRTPLRLLMAMDEFQKALIYDMEVAAQAYRVAKAEGAADIDARMAELIEDKEHEIHQLAVDKAELLTFQKELGEAGKAVSKAREGIPGLRYIIPFVRTPVNIFKQGLSKTAPGAAFNVARGLMDPNISKSEMNRRYAELMLGTLITLGLAEALGMFGDDDDEPWITGPQPFNTTKRGERDLAQRTAPPSSIRVGDRWYSYQFIEPFATTLGTTVGALEAVRDMVNNKDDKGQALGRAVATVTSQLKDKTFLSGIGDLMEAIEDPDRFVQSWATNFATSWVPNIARQTARESDPFVRETRKWGVDDWSSRMVDRIRYQALPLASNAPQPKVDLWGREIRKPEGFSPATDFMFRLLNPAPGRDGPDPEAVETKLDRLILNYNNLHPSDTFAPEAPRPTFQFNLSTSSMTDQEYHDFMQVAGREAVRRLEPQLNGDKFYRQLNVDQPDAADIEAIKDALSKGRDKAKRELLKKRRSPDAE